MADTSIENIQKVASGNIIEKLTFDMAGRLAEIDTEISDYQTNIKASTAQILKLRAERETVKRGVKALKGQR